MIEMISLNTASRFVARFEAKQGLEDTKGSCVWIDLGTGYR